MLVKPFCRIFFTKCNLR